jgi:hypothetical protein
MGYSVWTEFFMRDEQKLAKNGFTAAQRSFSLPGGAGSIMMEMKPFSIGEKTFDSPVVNYFSRFVRKRSSV